jgi:HrpA-like RNA helicase
VTIFQIHKDAKGDILCFLTGQEEIENLEKLINEKSKALGSNEDKVGS